MTRERPILFSAPMVRAILYGRKTQTRRLAKPQNNSACPYGERGDRLYLREAFAYSVKDPDSVHEPGQYNEDTHDIVYRASSDGAGEWEHYEDGKRSPCAPPWRPGIHMPRWASRITLEITDVRVQRLWDITDDDARAEGVEPYTPPHGHISPEQRVPGPGFERCRLGDQPHRLPFAHLWDRINGKRAAWSSNPWVWAITFKRLAP